MFFKLWSLIIVAVVLWRLFKWLQRRRLLEAAETWPIAQGRIVDLEIQKRSRGRGDFDSGDPTIRFSFRPGTGNVYYQTNLNYTYMVAEQYSGIYSRQFDFEQDASSFAEATRNQPVLVRYKSGDPRKSLIRKQDIDAVLQSNAPRPALPTSPVNFGPATRAFFAIWALLSFAGFLISLAVNMAGWGGHVILPPPLFFGMHMGCIVSAIPMIFIGRKISGTWRSNQTWRILRNCAGWMRAGFIFLFCYTLLNFFLFIAAEGPGKHSGLPGPLEWRGFSGHWMLFYAMSAAVCFWAAKENRAMPESSIAGPI